MFWLFVTTLWAGQMGIEIPEALKAFRQRNLEREKAERTA